MKKLYAHDADGHAPFAHYLIVIPPSTVKIRDPKTRKIQRLEKPGAEYVVCFFCGHWIDRPLAKCKCPATCHTEALHGE